MNKEEYIKSISKSLAILNEEIKIRNSIRLYDINKLAEDFVGKLLNIVYGFELKNLNYDDTDAAGIDLVDDLNLIAVQVTSTNSSKKVSDTVNKFLEYDKYRKYNRLIIYLVSEKKISKKVYETKGVFAFDQSKDILNYKDIIKEISQTQDISKVRDIETFLHNEAYSGKFRSDNTESNEIETIMDLIQYLSTDIKYSEQIVVVFDPEYKIKKRFAEFSERIENEYKQSSVLYRSKIEQIELELNIDNAQSLLIQLYLQHESLKFLDKHSNNPLEALNSLVDYFEQKISNSGIKYSKMAIRFYLVNEIIKCNVFPNQKEDYYANK